MSTQYMFFFYYALWVKKSFNSGVGAMGHMTAQEYYVTD